jgi:hypothetical protein
LHQTVTVEQEVAKHGTLVLPHSMYSPDLTPYNVYLSVIELLSLKDTENVEWLQRFCCVRLHVVAARNVLNIKSGGIV